MSTVMIKGEEIKLKPCPFCGFQAQVVKIQEGSTPEMPEYTRISVGCARCGANSKTYFTFNITDTNDIKEAEEKATRYAVEAWNRRGMFNET